MATDNPAPDARRLNHCYRFDRHAPDYRDQFEAITAQMDRDHRIAWTDTCGGHWVAAGGKEVFELVRCPHVSNDHDVTGERKGYQGIAIPAPDRIPGVRDEEFARDEDAAMTGLFEGVRARGGWRVSDPFENPGA